MYGRTRKIQRQDAEKHRAALANLVMNERTQEWFQTPAYGSRIGVLEYLNKQQVKEKKDHD